jgi:homoserine kinase
MAISKSKRKGKNSLLLALPATSANLGPAFDAAALALNLFLKIEASPATEFSVEAHGRDAAICAAKQDHLILTTYEQVLREAGKRVTPLALAIENEMPIGKGCGSSAAARLAGIALAVHSGNLGWNDARIVGEASRREHHPDNAAACWHGGLAVARMSDSGEASVAIVRPKGSWPLLLAVPAESLPTEEARSVLPSHYLRSDAVNNVQNSMLLLAAFVQGRPGLLEQVLEDRMHQPYRAGLCPLLPALQKLAGQSGILGVALSGAGPSVLVFLDPRSNPGKAKKLVAAYLQRVKLQAELFSTEITLAGAREGASWKRKHGAAKKPGRG